MSKLLIIVWDDFVHGISFIKKFILIFWCAKRLQESTRSFVRMTSQCWLKGEFNKQSITQIDVWSPRMANDIYRVSQNFIRCLTKCYKPMKIWVDFMMRERPCWDFYLISDMKIFQICWIFKSYKPKKKTLHKGKTSSL